MSETANIVYNGTPLPLGANTYDLFSTIGLAMPNIIAMTGMKRLVVDLSASQGGTFTWQKSNDRGVTWLQLSTQAATAGSNQLDLLVEEYRDFRLQFTNGGVDQTQFGLNMALTGDRVKST